MYTVYSLIDPRDHSTRYVGITEDVYSRMRQHSRCSGGNDAKNVWIQDLQKAQLVFIMHSLEKVDTFSEALERELYWIGHYLAQGISLLNIAGVPRSVSGDESKLNISPSGFVRYNSAQFLSKLYFRGDNGDLFCLSDAPAWVFIEYLRQYVSYDWLSVGDPDSRFSPWNGSGYRCHWINDLRRDGYPLEIYTRDGRQITDLVGNPFKGRTTK